MKIAFITNIYKDEEIKHLTSLKKEIKLLNFPDFEIFVTDSRNDNRGYSYGLNKGIKKAIKQGFDTFVVCNPDISIKSLKKEKIIEGLKHFDILSFGMRQQGKIFYGGEIDKWRLSGGLIDKKPINRFQQVDFISTSLAFIKKTVIDKIGLFDEDYFMYYDDTDFCFRAGKQGLKAGVDSQQIYDHFEISNTNNPQKEFMLARSRLRFLLKCGSLKQKLYELFRSPKTFWQEKELLYYYAKTNAFSKNFLSLNVSAVTNRFFNFVLFLFLIRYLNVEEYGIYSLIWTHVSLLNPIMDLGTTSYGIIYLPNEKRSKFSSLYSMRFVISSLLIIATIILAVLFQYEQKIVIYVILASVVLLANSQSGSLLILTSVLQKLHIPSIASVIYNLFLTISLIFILVTTKRLLYVFVTLFVFYGIYAIVNTRIISKLYSLLKFTINIQEIKEILSRSYIFILIGLFSGLYFKADIFLLNALKGKEEVGIYTAGYKFFEAFLFLAASYNLSRMPLFANLARDNIQKLQKKVRSDAVFLTTIGITVSLSVFMFAPFILPFFITDSYKSAILVLQIIIFSLPLILITSILLNCLYALKKIKLVFALFAIQFFINISLNVLLIPYYSYFASAWITILCEILNIIFSIYLVRKYLYAKRV